MKRMPVAIALTTLALLPFSTAQAIQRGGTPEGPAALLEHRHTLPALQASAPDEALQETLRAAPAWQRFSRSSEGRWHVAFDAVSRRPRRMFGSGIPLLPGQFNGLTLGDLELTGDKRAIFRSFVYYLSFAVLHMLTTEGSRRQLSSVR